MRQQRPRVVGALIGNINRRTGASTKYGLFFEAIGRRFPLVGVYDASLRGLDRFINGLRTVHLDPQLWRERFYKNIPAFEMRSKRAAAFIKSIQGEMDVILQIGVLFDACWDGVDVPSVIYTDYTAHLAAEKPAFGRSPFNSKQRNHWIKLEQRSFERAAHICTRSQLVSDSIINDYGIPPERITVVGGGVNFSPLPEPVVHRHGDTPTVLFIGKELYRKGGDLLLRAFAETRKQVPNARLIFVTKDPIPSNLPTDGVEIIAPTWKREVIARCYQRADVLVLPSRLETWGDVLLEAMIYGLPCIGVSGQAMEEIIVNEKTGLVVPPEDVMALAAALTRLLTNPALRQEWGRVARQRAEAEYTWDKVVCRSTEAIRMAANCTYSS